MLQYMTQPTLLGSQPSVTLFGNGIDGHRPVEFFSKDFENTPKTMPSTETLYAFTFWNVFRM